MVTNQQGRVVLVVILFVILLVAASFYLGRVTTKNNSQLAVASPSVATSEIVSVSPSPLTTVSPEPIQSPQSKSTSAPSIAPSPKPDVEIKQEADAKRYIDNKHGFAYKFANSLTLNNSVSDPSFAQFLEYQSGTGNAARMISQVFNNPNNSSLDEVIKRENILSYSELGPKYEYFKIQGHDAVKLTKTMTQTEICNDGDGTTKNRVFNFLVKGDGYVFEVHPNDSCESFKRNWFDVTPQTFAFLK